jgi:hypothetical protein
MDASVKCARCRRPTPTDQAGHAACAECSKTYAVCNLCGGEAAAKRSLHSHAALYHTKKKEAR